MKKKNMFLDHDGVMVDEKPYVLLYLNERYKINLRLADNINFDLLHEVIQLHTGNPNLTFDEVYLDIGKNFHASDIWNERMPIIEDMPKVAPELAKKYNLHIATARQKIGHSALRTVYHRHIPKCIQELHCAWDYEEGRGFWSVPKATFIQNFEGEKIAFIDDTLKEVLGTKDIIPSYLFDLHGVHTKETEIPKLESWKHIGDTFL